MYSRVPASDRWEIRKNMSVAGLTFGFWMSPRLPAARVLATAWAQASPFGSAWDCPSGDGSLSPGEEVLAGYLVTDVFVLLLATFINPAVCQEAKSRD